MSPGEVKNAKSPPERSRAGFGVPSGAADEGSVQLFRQLHQVQVVNHPVQHV